MRTLKLLIGAGIVASAFHFGDNAIELGNYTGPNWITPVGVVVAWCVVTAIALVALRRRRADTVFFTCAGTYAFVLLGGLDHYAFGPAMAMPLRSNVTVIVEALTGLALAAALIAGRSSTARLRG